MGVVVSGTVMVALAAAGCAAQRPKVRPVTSMPDAEAARLKAEDGNFDRAKDPKYTPETRYAAGQLAESQKDLPRAVEQYREALKLNPDHLPSLYRLGIVYTQQRQYGLAIDVWNRYVVATRNSATAYSNLGFCYELAGQPDQAERAYKEGIARDSASDPCRINYGLMLARHNRINEATLQLQKVLSPAEVHYNLASVFESQGRRDQARLEYRKALELRPDFEDAQARLDAIE
jgi:tetratricopeptide (TPR) repeat protein